MKNKIVPKFKEMESFSLEVISLAERDKIGYIEAVTEYCQTIVLEIEIAASLITPTLVSKISEEARKQNLIQVGRAHV